MMTLRSPFMTAWRFGISSKVWDWPDRCSCHYLGCRSLYRWQLLHSRRNQVFGGSGGYRPERSHLGTRLAQGHSCPESRNNSSDTGFKTGWRRKGEHVHSQYAFAMAHVHGWIYEHRSLLPSEGKTIKNKYEIVQLLEAIWLPTKLPLFTGQDIKKTKAPKLKVTTMLIKLPKRLLSGNPSPTQTVLELSAVSEPHFCLDEDVPEYNPEETKSYSDLGAQESSNGWWILPEGRIYLPKVLGLRYMQRGTYFLQPNGVEAQYLVSFGKWALLKSNQDYMAKNNYWSLLKPSQAR